MTNLTTSEARRLIDKLHHNQTKEHGISILEEKYLAALEIALPLLEGRIATSMLPKEAFNRLYDQHLMGVNCGKGNKSAAEGFLNACVVALYESSKAPPNPQTDTYRQIENDGREA